jgi:hypothetical protein
VKAMEEEAEKLKALQSEVEQQITADVNSRKFLSFFFDWKLISSENQLPDDGRKDGNRQSIDLRWTGFLKIPFKFAKTSSG